MKPRRRGPKIYEHLSTRELIFRLLGDIATVRAANLHMTEICAEALDLIDKITPPRTGHTKTKKRKAKP
jgi:hypothetical protein